MTRPTVGPDCFELHRLPSRYLRGVRGHLNVPERRGLITSSSYDCEKGQQGKRAGHELSHANILPERFFGSERRQQLAFQTVRDDNLPVCNRLRH